MLGRLDVAGERGRPEALTAVFDALAALVKGADLEAAAAPASMPESRAIRIADAKQAIAAVARDLPLIVAGLEDARTAARLPAARILRWVGPAGRPAIPALLRLFDDDDARVRDAASGAVADIGPDDEAVVPALVEALASTDANVRQNATWALYKLGPKAGDAVAALVTTLGDPRVDTRVNVARALGAIGYAARPAWDALVSSARERHVAVRKNAIWALRKITAAFSERLAGNVGLSVEECEFLDDTKKKLASLVKGLLHDPDDDIREQAAWALGTAGDEAKDALPDLLGALSSATPACRAAIVWAIGQIGPETEDAVAPLAAALADANPEIRRNASFALYKLGPKAKAAVPALVGTLADDAPATRLNAVCSLAEIGPAAKDAAPHLVRMLGSDDPAIVSEVASALHAIDPDSDAAIPELIPLLDGAKEETRAAAAGALERYGPRARAALPGLVRMLRVDRSGDAARPAAAALVAIDRSGAVAIPAICEQIVYFGPSLLDDVRGWIRDYGEAARAHGSSLARLLMTTGDEGLIEVLIGIKVDRKDLVPALEAVMAKQVNETEVFAYRTFARADPAGDLAIPALIRLLGHPEGAVRHGAAHELSYFGPKGKEAIPALLRMFHDPAGDEESTLWERSRALHTLAAIGAPARHAAPGVIERISVLRPGQRFPLLGTLAHLDPENPAVVGLIARQLSEEAGTEGDTCRLRIAAVDALRRLGPRAAAAVPALLKRLAATTTDDLRVQVTSALAAIGPGASEARAALEGQLADASIHLLDATRRALASIGCPLTEDEVARLADTLRASPKSPDAVIAANRLGLAGPVAKPSLPALVAALGAPPWNLREAAAWAIGALGPDAAAAVPDLISVLNAEAGDALQAPDSRLSESSDRLVEQILAALGRIGPAAKPAIPVISKLPDYLGGAYTIRRIDPPSRKPLTIVIDPNLAPPDVPLPEEEQRPMVVEKQPDGSFRVVVCSPDGFGGWCATLFLTRNPEGRPVATADVSTWSDVSSGNSGPDPVEFGTLTLKSDDWGSGKPIIGFVRPGLDPNALGLAFEVPDPFASATRR